MLNLIEHLPSNSHTRAAIASDEDAAREYVAMLERDPSFADRRDDQAEIREYSPEVDRLAELIDSVRELLRVTIMANSREGAAQPKIPWSRRPRYAITRVKAKVRQEAFDDLLKML